MALKGNLLFNGDFETGTVEGWETAPFNKPFDGELFVSEDAKYRGNYGGVLKATKDWSVMYVAYDKLCSFEEYEGFLYIVYCKNVSGVTIYPILYGTDDKGELIEALPLGYTSDTGNWLKYQAILRGFGDITHFKVGLYAYAYYKDSLFYFDEAKLIPLRSIQGHVLSENKHFADVTSDKKWHATLACIGRCRLRSILQTVNVSGSSPTLDTTLSIKIFPDQMVSYTLNHSQFTGEEFEEVTIDLPEISFITIEYKLGGTDPKFTIRHRLRVELDGMATGAVLA